MTPETLVNLDASVMTGIGTVVRGLVSMGSGVPESVPVTRSIARSTAASLCTTRATRV
jgi:hypothetical protein